MDITPGVDYTVEVDEDNNMKEVAISEESKSVDLKEEKKVNVEQPLEKDTVADTLQDEPKKKKKKKKNKNKGADAAEDDN